MPKQIFEFRTIEDDVKIDEVMETNVIYNTIKYVKIVKIACGC